MYETSLESSHSNPNEKYPQLATFLDMRIKMLTQENGALNNQINGYKSKLTQRAAGFAGMLMHEVFKLQDVQSKVY